MTFVPHYIRPRLANVLDVADLEAEHESWQDELRELERIKEQAGVEALRPTALPEKD